MESSKNKKNRLVRSDWWFSSYVNVLLVFLDFDYHYSKCWAGLLCEPVPAISGEIPRIYIVSLRL